MLVLLCRVELVELITGLAKIRLRMSTQFVKLGIGIFNRHKNSTLSFQNKFPLQLQQPKKQTFLLQKAFLLIQWAWLHFGILKKFYSCGNHSCSWILRTNSLGIMWSFRATLRHYVWCTRIQLLLSAMTTQIRRVKVRFI